MRGGRRCACATAAGAWRQARSLLAGAGCCGRAPRARSAAGAVGAGGGSCRSAKALRWAPARSSASGRREVIEANICSDRNPACGRNGCTCPESRDMQRNRPRGAASDLAQGHALHSPDAAPADRLAAKAARTGSWRSSRTRVGLQHHPALGRRAAPGGRRPAVRRAAGGRERRGRRPAVARHPPRRLDRGRGDRDRALRRDGARRRCGARLTLGRGRVGGGDQAYLGERRALGQLRAVPGPGGADRVGRHLPGLGDPDRGRDGGGAGVRPDRRHLRGGAAAPPPPRRPLRPGAGCRLSGWRSRE